MTPPAIASSLDGLPLERERRQKKCKEAEIHHAHGAQGEKGERKTKSCCINAAVKCKIKRVLVAEQSKTITLGVKTFA
jgi:hypothetical protein